MLVLVNARPRDGAHGGANAFLRSLFHALAHLGVRTTTDEREQWDVALLNALTERLDLDTVRRLADTGRPLVHRKTGYLGRGAPGLRATVGGVVLGDAHQVAFDPYLRHSIFQSEYSRGVFRAAGHSGASTVIPNGVDEAVFTPAGGRLPWHAGWRPRAADEPWRIVVSTWSTDDAKGFPEYRRIDAQFAGRQDVALTLVGRVPPDTQLGAFAVISPRGPRRLAAVLRRHHVILQLAQWETCSNALLEGLNCGLAAIYLDSGANAEVAAPYGVPYEGDLTDALARLEPRYDAIVGALPDNPFRISEVAERYRALLEHVVAGTEASADTPR